MGLFPKTEDFFAYFKKSANNILEAAKYLESVLQNGGMATDALKRLEDYEHAGDKITHETMEKLNKTFVTPIDREDIHQLVSSLDDIMDYIYSAGEALALYKIHPVPGPLKGQAKILVQLTIEISRAMEQLSNLKNSPMILANCIEINRLENEADNIHRRALATLFENEKDPIHIIKTKEVLEDLETSIDMCEDVANVIEGIVLKNA